MPVQEVTGALLAGAGIACSCCRVKCLRVCYPQPVIGRCVGCQWSAGTRRRCCSGSHEHVALVGRFASGMASTGSGGRIAPAADADTVADGTEP